MGLVGSDEACYKDICEGGPRKKSRRLIGLVPRSTTTMSYPTRILLLALAAVLAGGCSSRREPEPLPSPSPPAAVKAADVEKTVEEPAAEAAETAAETAEEKYDPCALPRPGEEADWLDRTRRGVQRSVCSAALWFDSLFGKDRAYDERDETFGWVRPTFEWDEVEGLRPRLKMRAKISLPAFDNRLNAVFGRTSEEAFIEDSSDSAREDFSNSFSDTDDEWLVGLGYTPVRNAKRRFDFTGGIKLRAPPDVFVQGRYRRQFFLRDVNLVRFRQTAFWDTDDGLGFSTQVDAEHLFDTGGVLRWRNRGKVAQRINGVEWLSELTLFQSLAPGQAIAWQAEILGETDEVFVKRYALRAIYRRQMSREWLILELRPGFAWIRERPDDRRQFTPVLAFGFELHFGKSHGTSFH